MSPLSKSPSLSPIKKSPAVRKSRRKYDFPIETLRAYSHYRQDEAAKMLNVASITLKRICHRLHYRWPYRTIKAKIRREALAAQKKQNLNVLMKTPPSAPSDSLPIPELLLSLREDKKIPFNCSPTSVSDVPSRFPTAQFPPVNEPMKCQLPPQLPPLTMLLKKLEIKPRVIPPHLNCGRPTINYKSSFYSASFHSTAPKFPMGRLSTLANQCVSESWLQSSTDALVSCYPARQQEP